MTTFAASCVGADIPTDNSDYGPCIFHTVQPTPLTCLSILGTPFHVNGNKEALANIEGITWILIDRTANISSHGALFFLSSYAAVPRAT